MNVIYSKYNRNRLPSFQIKTIILEDNTELYVEKYALNSQANPHIEAIYSNYYKQREKYPYVQFAKVEKIGKSGLRFDFIRGQTMDALLLEAVLSKNVILFVEHIKEYRDFLNGFNPIFKAEFQPNQQFSQVFGCTPFFENVECLPETNIDLTFDNVLLSQSNKVVIDYEWIFDTSVPLNFIVYRSISRFFWKYGEYLQDFISINDLFRELNIGYLDEFQQMENGFQSYVLGTREHGLSQTYKRNDVKVSDIVHDLNDCKSRISEYSGLLERKEEELRDFKDKELNLHNEMAELNRKMTHCLFQSDKLKDENKRLSILNEGLLNDKEINLNMIYMLENSAREVEERVEAKLNEILLLEQTFRGRLLKRLAGKKFSELAQSVINENAECRNSEREKLIELNNTEIKSLRTRLGELETYITQLEEEKESSHLEINHLKNSLHDLRDEHHHIVLEKEHLQRTNHESNLKLNEINEAYQLLQSKHHQLKYEYSLLSKQLYQGLREEEE